MRNATIILLVFLFGQGVFAQDSLRNSLGFSINYFGDNIRNIISKTEHNKPVYFQDTYISENGRYDLGWNYRGSKFKFVNRASFNFMFSRLKPEYIKNSTYYEINLAYGYEWSPKRVKNLYYGCDVFGAKMYYKYKTDIQKYYAVGILPFVGYKVNVSKRVQLRSELSFAAYYYSRKNISSHSTEHRNGFAIFGHKLFSLELYFKF